MTAREWKPGDVAMVNDCTNPDAPWEPATCQASAVKGECEAVWVLHKSGARVWGSVSKARPLVVIDPEDREQVERLAKVFNRTDGPVLGAVFADRLQAALRELANPTPPKLEEPTGLGAVVEDSEGRWWSRVGGTTDFPWHHGTLGRECWSVDAVKVLSEGWSG